MYVSVCVHVHASVHMTKLGNKDLEAVPARKSTVYIMCSEYWRVRPGHAVSLRRGTGHRLMGQIMVRLMRTGSMFVGLEQKKEGSKGGG